MHQEDGTHEVGYCGRCGLRKDHPADHRISPGGVTRAIIDRLIKAIADANNLEQLCSLFSLLSASTSHAGRSLPVAQTFLSLGMHRGPLLAYLLADPELSLQSILVTQQIIGKKKTAVYVGLVAVFSTLAGLIFGMFVE